MLYTIVSLADVFGKYEKTEQKSRSTNPYDYIRAGYYLDNAALFGGENNVNYNCDISGHITGCNIYYSRKSERPRFNLP